MDPSTIEVSEEKKKDQEFITGNLKSNHRYNSSNKKGVDFREPNIHCIEEKGGNG